MTKRTAMYRPVTRLLLGLGGLLLLLVVVGALWFAWTLNASKPKLSGTFSVAGLAAPVTIARDARGIPTISAASRRDLAFATGWLHAQERYFQMDGLRRAAAGEVGALVGSAGLEIDRHTKPHRFRARAQAAYRAMAPGERAVVDAYAAGVNRGLADLGRDPWEYGLLRAHPARWRPEDSILVVYAMYLDLQGPGPDAELARARAVAAVGPAMADFLLPAGTPLDAPLDASRLPEPPMPERVERSSAPAAQAPPAEPARGSNNWAVSGAHTATGAAMVANDMHLGLGVPNIWYRVRLKSPAEPGRPATDIVGVTLPGAPSVITGSNGRIAWGFTNSYIDTSDAVLLDPAPGGPDRYQTPEGPRSLVTYREQLCARTRCQPFPVRESIWGPVLARSADGRQVAQRWTAHDPGAVNVAASLALEVAGDVREAIAIAHRAGIPQQNFVVGDSRGHIAWTIIGRVPDRFGVDGRLPASWADGGRGWRGYLPVERIPVILDPPSGRIWTANARVVGGDAYARLGDGGYALAARAGRIRDRLFMQEKFTERDMLSIQLDTYVGRNRFWRDQMLSALEPHRGDAALAAMIEPVRTWDGQASVESVGHRLINTFRAKAIDRIYNGWLGKPEQGGRSAAPPQAEGPARRLLETRPAGLVPPGDASWRTFLDAVLSEVAADVRDQAGGEVARYRWGAGNPFDIRESLARVVPMLGWLTDPRDAPSPGDRAAVRVDGRGFGASERLAMSPGHEDSALFSMPGGQSSNPLSPYYLAVLFGFVFEQVFAIVVSSL